MIYVDTSVVLAHLLAEDRLPPPRLWNEPLVSSRLLEYELWNRLHRSRFAGSHGEAARQLTRRIAFLEMIHPVVSRALDAFPVPVRTLDAIHLASVEFLRQQAIDVQLATYDTRMLTAARRMKIAIYKL